ncbi:hypothetical protein [Mycoplasmopsis pulmonis]|uniref:hypothetical protein n=1 Tax=Mycoplasmopsis pulmonis TaxID=2107 RepID=UPI002ACEA0F8|nr:hypothetical protein [Mycoplasmopsis pulmonis]MDZ7293137.1 hypothetical protein [Mycoplasmopsis pulmonis]
MTIKEIKKNLKSRSLLNSYLSSFKSKKNYLLFSSIIILILDFQKCKVYDLTNIEFYISQNFSSLKEFEKICDFIKDNCLADYEHVRWDQFLKFLFICYKQNEENATTSFLKWDFIAENKKKRNHYITFLESIWHINNYNDFIRNMLWRIGK